MLQSFYRQPLLEVLSVYFSLVDMRLIWRLASPTSDDCDAKTNSGIDYLWRDYLNRVCSMVYSRCNNATTIILIVLGVIYIIVSSIFANLLPKYFSLESFYIHFFYHQTKPKRPSKSILVR